jgi:hypothetical protein
MVGGAGWKLGLEWHALLTQPLQLFLEDPAGSGRNVVDRNLEANLVRVVQVAAGSSEGWVDQSSFGFELRLVWAWLSL